MSALDRLRVLVRDADCCSGRPPADYFDALLWNARDIVREEDQKAGLVAPEPPTTLEQATFRCARAMAAMVNVGSHDPRVTEYAEALVAYYKLCMSQATGGSR